MAPPEVDARQRPEADPWRNTRGPEEPQAHQHHSMFAVQAGTSEGTAIGRQVASSICPKRRAKEDGEETGTYYKSASMNEHDDMAGDEDLPTPIRPRRPMKHDMAAGEMSPITSSGHGSTYMSEMQKATIGRREPRAE